MISGPRYYLKVSVIMFILAVAAYFTERYEYIFMFAVGGFVMAVASIFSKIYRYLKGKK